jgi:uncharacterized protein YndB with AHSA1/START domain
MSSDDFGVPRADGGRLALRYERRYDATPDEVWSAFTEPASIRRWLFAETVLEPRVGGAFSLDWCEGQHAGGSVLVWEPPRVLEVEWIQTDMRSILRVEISAVEDGAVLVLDHRNVTLEPAISIGAGWHAHLETLDDVLHGRDGRPDHWRRRYDSLHPRYVELLTH